MKLKGEIMTYKPKEYWEKRLESQPNLKGVGCAGFNENYNKYLYSLKVSALDKILNKYYSITIKGRSILDVGCDTGFFVNYYHKKGAKKITGLDITKTSISMLKEKYPAYNFYVADISDPNHPLKLKEKFDIINAFDVLYHVTDNGKFETAINNISSLCLGGGYVLITDVFWKDDIIPAEHVRFRSLQKYKEILPKNNIEILDIFPIYYLISRGFYLPAFVLNRIGSIFCLVDKSLRGMKIPNGKNIKLLIGKKRWQND
ncbi:hypothetical protein C5S30_02800 [ANME-1 cluster archaeon GoMg4]|nr:hypothetical protein [ANME-1 cluster archaeon GoMg4]